MKNLVIVESPAKAKTIEKFLGKDYKVMSSFGHIRDLKKKNFGVDLDSFQPQYEIPSEKQNVVRSLRSEAKKADTVWLASDEDREGEAIAWHLAEVLGLDPQTTRRIVFHEITKTAILSAIETPRTIDLNLVDAQQARRVLDRLVGFKISPVLWHRVRPSLSAGRVQSVAVRLIVEREREITSFKSVPTFRVVAHFLPQGATGKADAIRATLGKGFKSKKDAENFLEACRDAQFTVRSVSTKPVKRTPAPPFTTSTLQQEAARKLGFPVATTMRVAQSLYEAGLITYMRTDSTNLSDLCLNTCGPVIEERFGSEYHKRRRYHVASKGAQEAHEAIRPTYMDRVEAGKTAQERKLYSLIWHRTLACQMADALLEKTTIEIGISTREERFTATGEVVKFDGFLHLYRESTSDDDVQGREEEALLPPLQEGAALQQLSVQATQHYSLPPARYTEASLVHKLEELGIGRPSTYAPTISTIQQREYVVRGDKAGTPRSYEVLTLKDGALTAEMLTENAGSEKGKLLPTDVGVVVNDFLMDTFPDIMDYNFTAHVEKEFDEVAAGKKEWTGMISSFYRDLEPQVENAMNERTEHRVGERVIGTDPVSGRPVAARIGRFGPMVQIGLADDAEKPRFATLRKGQSIETISLEEALDLFRLPRTIGEWNGAALVVNTGRFGPYVQHGKTFASLPKTIDPLDVTEEEAIKILQEKQAKEAASHLKTFEEDPTVEVRTGRFGPYICCQGKNYRLSKALAARATELTLEECREIIANSTPTGGKKSKK